MRHSFLNGWHPVIPWLAFLLVGMAIARADISRFSTRLKLAFSGIVLVLLAFFAKSGLDLMAVEFLGSDEESADMLLLLLSSSPVPPAPFYMISATGSAITLLMLCLWLGDKTGAAKWLYPVVATGRQALTLYIGHILVGMGLLEAMGWVWTEDGGGDVSLAAASWAAILFVLASMLYASLWQKLLGQGPLETLLRVLAK